MDESQTCPTSKHLDTAHHCLIRAHGARPICSMRLTGAPVGEKHRHDGFLPPFLFLLFFFFSFFPPVPFPLPLSLSLSLLPPRVWLDWTGLDTATVSGGMIFAYVNVNYNAKPARCTGPQRPHGDHAICCVRPDNVAGQVGNVGMLQQGRGTQ